MKHTSYMSNTGVIWDAARQCWRPVDIETALLALPWAFGAGNNKASDRTKRIDRGPKGWRIDTVVQYFTTGKDSLAGNGVWQISLLEQLGRLSAKKG